MNYATIILQIYEQLDGEREQNAAFYILRGKRSGQSIQDVAYFSLFRYYSLFPSLSKEEYDRALKTLLENRYLIKDDQSFCHVTPTGKKVLKNSTYFQWNGWAYRGREQLFFERLQLLVQTASYMKQGITTFLPLVRRIDVQQDVRHLYKRYPMHISRYRHQLREELVTILQSIQSDQRFPSVMAWRLGGAEDSPYTWRQISEHLKIEESSLQFIWIEGLHLLLERLKDNQNFPILKEMTKGIYQQSYLTDSAEKTYILYQKGYKREEIEKVRQLKRSTIEDHFVEMAIYIPSFSIEPFVHKEDQVRVAQFVQQQRTRRLRKIKEAFPELSYFQIRLILGKVKKCVEVC